MSGIWVVARVKLNSEHWAAENLSRQGFDFYLPMIAEVIRPRGLINGSSQRLLVGRPLFRGYVFVDIENKRWQPLLSTRGLLGLLGVDHRNQSRPTSLPDGTVEDLRGRENSHGMVMLPKCPGFLPGQQIRLNDGPLKGHKGIYQGMHNRERVEILLEYLGRKTNVLLARELVEAV